MKGNIGLSGRFEGLKKKVYKNEPAMMKMKTLSPHGFHGGGLHSALTKHKRGQPSLDFEKDLDFDLVIPKEM